MPRVHLHAKNASNSPTCQRRLLELFIHHLKHAKNIWSSPTFQRQLELTLSFIFYSMDKLALGFFICSTNKHVEEEEVIVTLSLN